MKTSWFRLLGSTVYMTPLASASIIRIQATLMMTSWSE